MRRVALLLIAGLALLLPEAGIARGQTPPNPPENLSSPTPTSTPLPRVTPTPTGPPDAQALLDAMKRAMVQAGTLRFQQKSTSIVPGKSLVRMTSTDDVSFRNNALHDSTTSVRSQLGAHPTSATEQRELKVVGQRAAWRTPSMSWQCEQIGNQNVSNSVLAFQAQPRSAQLAGTAVIAGTTVWRVRTKATIYSWTGSKQLDTVEFDIAQASGTAVRVMASFTMHHGGSNEPVKLTETYSRYGVPVHITLPKKCR